MKNSMSKPSKHICFTWSAVFTSWSKECEGEKTVRKVSWSSHNFCFSKQKNKVQTVSQCSLVPTLSTLITGQNFIVGRCQLYFKRILSLFIIIIFICSLFRAKLLLYLLCLSCKHHRYTKYTDIESHWQVKHTLHAELYY